MLRGNPCTMDEDLLTIMMFYNNKKIIISVFEHFCNRYENLPVLNVSSWSVHVSFKRCIWLCGIPQSPIVGLLTVYMLNPVCTNLAWKVCFYFKMETWSKKLSNTFKSKKLVVNSVQATFQIQNYWCLLRYSIDDIGWVWNWLILEQTRTLGFNNLVKKEQVNRTVISNKKLAHCLIFMINFDYTSKTSFS